MLMALLVVVAGFTVTAQTPNANFQQAVAVYLQSPSDASAEKVIKLAAAMDQLPPIPEEARRHFVRGTTLFKDAKSPDDYKQVDDELLQAVHLAPWWPDARYNWALAQEAAGDYASAISNVKLYLLFKLSEADARAAQDKIYVIEAKQEKAAKVKTEPVSQPATAQQENSLDALLRSINGRRYAHKLQGDTVVFDVRNDILVLGVMWDPPNDSVYRPTYEECVRVTITGPEITLPLRPRCSVRVGTVGLKANIGDGDSIIMASEIEDGRIIKDVFFWQR